MSFSLSSTPCPGSFPQNWITKFSFLFLRTRRGGEIIVAIHLNQNTRSISPGNFFHIALPISYTLTPFAFLAWFSVILTKWRGKLAHFQKRHFHLYSLILFLTVYHLAYSLTITGSPHFMLACHSQLSEPHKIKMLLFLNNDMTVTHPHGASCQLGISELSAGREVPI